MGLAARTICGAHCNVLGTSPFRAQAGDSDMFPREGSLRLMVDK
jgi:hypothetical protein